MSYSEGNTYCPTVKWTLFERISTSHPWQFVEHVTDPAEAGEWTNQNTSLGWQKYAFVRHTN